MSTEGDAVASPSGGSELTQSDIKFFMAWATGKFSLAVWSQNPPQKATVCVIKQTV